MQENVVLASFNRGVIDQKALARIDLKRVALSAETQTNWMPRALGSMMLRAGLGYIGSTNDDARAVHIPFFYAIDDLAILEVTEGAMRVYIDDAIISRAAVSSAVTNGNFGTDLTGWTDADESGATSTWNALGAMQLNGTGVNSAIRRQEVTVAIGDQNKEHALRVVILRGPVTLKVGSTSGASDYIREVSLATGAHSLAFTPTGNFWIELSGRRIASTLVDSINVEASGDMELPVPWQDEDLSYLRWDQSGDVIFVACKGFQQRRIQRSLGETNPRSWAVVLYEPQDGPFRIENVTPTTITPSAISGDITLTASRPIFNAGQIGGLFNITSQGQRTEATITAANSFTDPVRVTGVGASRTIAVTLSGTWSATVRLQRSVGDEIGTWEDVSVATWTTNITTSYTDGLDNQIVYYRLGVKTGEFTSGSISAVLSYALGSIVGIVRITAFSSTTSVTAAVLTNLGGTTATDRWAEGEWSDFRGWPSAVALVEGRLGWAGKDKAWVSVSDAFDSFDPETEGDSGPIVKTLGTGVVDTANWMLALQRLLIGGAASELSMRSSSFDEILTPTNSNIKPASTQGSAPVAAVRVDASGMMVQRSGQRVYELAQADSGIFDYSATDLTALVPDLNNAGITKIAVQRQPDTRLHCVRADGTVGVLVFDKTENVICWVEVETAGEIEDVVVLPGTGEDRVYYSVMRTIDGQPMRYFEKFSLEIECQGGTLNKQADSFIAFTNGPPSATVAVPHLEGEDVIVWADGKCMRTETGDIATFTVTGGVISLTNGGEAFLATTGIVGLPYEAPFKSTKLAYAAAMGTPLAMRKKVHGLGLILSNAHYQGLKFGRDFDHLVSMDKVVKGKPTPEDYVWPAYDNDPMIFPGDWDTDSRVCLLARAPRPCTILAAIVGMATYDRS